MAELDYQSLNVFINRAVRGDSNAFAELYAGTYQHQYRFAVYFLKDIYQAQDALLQVYTYALQHLASLKDPTHLIEWLEQINYNICYHMLYHAPDVPSGKLLRDLSYLESAIFLMSADQNMNVNDIARATERTQKEVQHLLKRAQKKMRRKELSLHTSTVCNDIPASKLDAKGADIILSSILENCGYDTNSISIATFGSSHLFKTETYALQKTLLALILCALLALPLLFLIPTMQVTERIDSGSKLTAYDIEVKSLLRVKSVSAQSSGKELPISETAQKVYTVEPHTSGTVTVTVTLENGQYNSIQFQAAPQEQSY